jgi:SAM-dependent methyltransferase
MTISTDAPDFTAIKARQRQTWASGNYHVIASMIVPISEHLVDTVELRAGERVLDVATGSGNTALSAARRLAIVTGMDYEPGLLERGRIRATAEGLPVSFEEGDAEDLPVHDGAFDVVLSTLGVMFAPNQEQSARELLRVTRPGGRIGLANWAPDGWIGEMLRAVGRHVPPPAGLRPVTRWGTEEGLRELLGAGTSSLQITRQTFVWRFESTEHFLDLFRTYYGPVHKAFAAVDADGADALASDLLDTVRRFAREVDGTLLVPADYVEAVAVKAAKSLL